MRWLWLVIMLAGCFEVPDASSCMDACSDQAIPCLQRAVDCTDSCIITNPDGTHDTNLECATDCAHKQILCLKEMFDCVNACVDEVENSL